MTGRIKRAGSPVLPSMKMTVLAAKRALSSADPVLVGNAMKRLARDGLCYDDMFRLALATDPTLTRNEWQDRVAAARKAISPFAQLAAGDRIRAGKRSYKVTCVDFHAGVVELSTGRTPGRSIITLMASGVDEGKFVVASARAATTIDSFTKV